jgi:hypothetical protein
LELILFDQGAEKSLWAKQVLLAHKVFQPFGSDPVGQRSKVPPLSQLGP